MSTGLYVVPLDVDGLTVAEAARRLAPPPPGDGVVGGLAHRRARHL